MQYLYKFRQANDRDIQTLKEDKLWLPKYEYLNDATDFSPYVSSNNTQITDEQISSFIKSFKQSYCCLSFSKSPTKKKLWNNYGGNLKGMIIAYRPETIKIAMDDAGIDYLDGAVIYDSQKTDISKYMYDQSNEMEKQAFLHKDNSWNEECEYRFVINLLRSKLKAESEKGIMLCNVIPSHIFIGMDMDSNNRCRIIEYCKMKGICLYEISPDYRSPDSKAYKRKIILSKNDKPELINKEYAVSIK